MTNEKRLVDRAGLRGIDAILAGREADTMVEQAKAFLQQAVESGGQGAGV